MYSYIFYFLQLIEGKINNNNNNNRNSRKTQAVWYTILENCLIYFNLIFVKIVMLKTLYKWHKQLIETNYILYVQLNV